MKNLANEVNKALGKDQTQEAVKPKKSYIDKLESRNKRVLDNAKEVYDEYSDNRKKAHDDLIRLHKSIAEYENPYKSLEIALSIIQALTGEETYLAAFDESVEVIRARALKDENAKMYSIDRINELIERVEANQDIPEKEKAQALVNLKRKRDEYS